MCPAVCGLDTVPLTGQLTSKEVHQSLQIAPPFGTQVARNIVLLADVPCKL